jgi:hypothetical protein
MTPAAFTVNELYELMNFICNKKQSGAVKPDDYNRMLKMVNLEMFKVYSGLPEEFGPGPQSPRRVWQANNKITDILRPFHKIKFIAKQANDFFPVPDDYAAFSSLMRVQIDSSDECSKAAKKKWKVIELVTEAERTTRLGNRVKPPTLSYPIAAYYDLGLLVDPEEIPAIRMAYLRYPKVPFRNYDNINDEDKYVAQGSVDLEWPAIAHIDFVIRMCRYVGINIREEELVGLVSQRLYKGE